MKVLKNLFGLILISTLCFSLSSCVHDDDLDTDFFLVGSWASNDDPSNIVYLDFLRNGNGSVQETEYSLETHYDSFTWYSSSRYIYITYNSDGVHEKWDYDLTSQRLRIGERYYLRID